METLQQWKARISKENYIQSHTDLVECMVYNLYQQFKENEESTHSAIVYLNNALDDLIENPAENPEQKTLRKK